MLNVKIIIASTRPGRKGPSIGQWITEKATAHSDFSIELLDLATINLPFLDEPNHPRLQKYHHQHTKDWSAKIDNGDAYIIVTPEYNFGYPASLKNALDFLYNEWCYKPVAFVSYGGLSGGMRSVQMLKQVVTAQKMMPVTESVHIPFFTKYLDQQEKFTADEGLNKSAELMFSELRKWASALKTMRENNKDVSP
jgi:NAD(P)H-dependent FMN reductase